MTAVLALLCAISIAPAACDRSNAVDVVTMPPSANELACMLDAQMTLAQLAIRADAEHRWIVRCVRTSIGQQGVG